MYEYVHEPGYSSACLLAGYRLCIRGPCAWPGGPDGSLTARLCRPHVWQVIEELHGAGAISDAERVEMLRRLEEEAVFAACTCSSLATHVLLVCVCLLALFCSHFG